MDLLEIWHYHRPQLAQSYLGLLNSGLIASTTIFAPRRTGKTSFLIKDLTPAAEALGFRVAYADLWQTELTPAAALIRALQKALEPKTLSAKILAKFTTPLKKVKARADVAGAKLEGEVEFDNSKQEITDQALLIDVLLEELVKDSPVLLLVDEAQALAHNKENEALAKALRTAMTRHQARLRVVFTGSSRTRLAHVFSNANAPLYSTGSAIQEFPLLDKGFIDYIAERFHDSTQRQLDVAKAWEAFLKFKCQPEPFLRAVAAMVFNPALTLDAAVDREMAAIQHADNHEELWARLDATQKFLVRLLANNPRAKPFSKTVLRDLRAALGVESLELTHVQRAMTKLGNENILIKLPSSSYEFENDGFAQWVRTLAD